MVAGGVYLGGDVRSHVLDIVGRFPETGVYGQEKVFAQHSLDDVFRGAYHVIVLVSALYLGKHHLVDVEGLVDDPYLLAGLSLIPFRKVGEHVLVDVVCPVIDFQNLLPVFLVVARAQRQQRQQCQGK